MKMASKFTVDEALRTDVDLSTVNAIVGSLETQLVTSSASVQQQQIHFTSANQQINSNSATVSNGCPISTSSQKKHHGVANGEISSSYSALNNNRVVNNLDIKTNNNNLSETTSTSAPTLIGTTTVASNGNNKISAPINNTFASNQIVSVNSQQYQTSHHQQTQLQPNQATSAIMSKNNEPVKLVYPSQTGVSQPAVINMNNRVTFTSQSLPNGTINLSTLTSQQQQGIIQTSSAGMTSVGGNSSGLKATAPQQQQQPTLVIQKQVIY